MATVDQVTRRYLVIPGRARRARPAWAAPAGTPSTRAASRGQRRSEHPRHGASPQQPAPDVAPDRRRVQAHLSSGILKRRKGRLGRPSPRGGGAHHAFNASQSSLRDLLQAPQYVLPARLIDVWGASDPQRQVGACGAHVGDLKLSRQAVEVLESRRHRPADGHLRLLHVPDGLTQMNAQRRFAFRAIRAIGVFSPDSRCAEPYSDHGVGSDPEHRGFCSVN